MVSAAGLLALGCAAAVAGLVLAEHRGHAAARAVLKTAASAAFVAVALALDAPDTSYGRWILAALVLGFAGDVLLLSDRDGAFRAGLGAFLLSHGAFAIAFAVAGPFSATTFGLALVPAALFGAGVLRWLWPGLAGADRVAVPAYVAAILLMAATAAGRWSATGQVTVLAGALLFAASDLAVARERFVAPGFLNKAWGLPAYFAAQLLLTSSVSVA